MLRSYGWDKTDDALSHGSYVSKQWLDVLDTITLEDYKCVNVLHKKIERVMKLTYSKPGEDVGSRSHTKPDEPLHAETQATVQYQSHNIMLTL